jgi:hypothetical protein
MSKSTVKDHYEKLLAAHYSWMFANYWPIS